MKWSFEKHGIKAGKKEKKKGAKICRRGGNIGGWERAKCDGLISPSGSCSKAMLIREESRHQGNERMPFMKYSSRKRETQRVKEHEETRESEPYNVYTTYI